MKESNKNFEESLKELEIIVKELEQGEVDLDKAIAKYSDAMKLAKNCDEKLTKATNDVNKILNENGNFENFEIPKED